MPVIFISYQENSLYRVKLEIYINDELKKNDKNKKIEYV